MELAHLLVANSSALFKYIIVVFEEPNFNDGSEEWTYAWQSLELTQLISP